MSVYVPLWCKSNFSFLEGASHPDELVEEAVRLERTRRCGGDARVVPSDFDAVGERVASLQVRIEADAQSEPAVSLLGRTAERRVGDVA